MFIGVVHVYAGQLITEIKSKFFDPLHIFRYLNAFKAAAVPKSLHIDYAYAFWNIYFF